MLDHRPQTIDKRLNYEATGLGPLKDRDSLALIKNILKDNGDPQKSFKIIHITGTKGKGSTSSFTAKILESAGLKVGLFTSPHIISPLERISVNGVDIKQEELDSIVQTIDYRQETKGQRLKTTDLTFFEMMTISAFVHFKQKKVDVAVLECGLGGRLDSTNAIESDVAVICNISYDHMNVLGETIAEIAGEKAGIIKKGTKLAVSAKQKDEAMKMLTFKCKNENIDLITLGEDIVAEINEVTSRGSEVSITTPLRKYRNCFISMPGKFQCENAALAVSASEKILECMGRQLDTKYVVEGLKNAYLPARLELLNAKPRMLFDGAQNAYSASKLKEYLEQTSEYDKLTILLSMASDKDIKGMCRELAALDADFIVTKFQGTRSADPFIIKGYLRGKIVRVAGDSKEALGLCFAGAGSNDLIVVCGSFYLIGEIKGLVSRI